MINEEERKMGRFCTKCGRPLQEGEICSCQQANAGIQGVNQQNVMPENQTTSDEINYQQKIQNDLSQGSDMEEKQLENKAIYSDSQGTQQNQAYVQPNTKQMHEAVGFLHGVFGKIVQMIKKPVSEGVNLIREADTKSGATIIIMQGIFSALFALIVCARFSSSIQYIAGMFDDTLGSALNGFNLNLSGALGLPYGRIFIITLLASIALSCLLALLLMIGNMIIKCKVPYKQMLLGVTVRSATLMPVTVVSIILFELNSGVGLFVFFVGNIWGIISIALALNTCNSKEKENAFALMYSVVVLAFIIITLFVMSKLWIYYLPDMLQTMFKGVLNALKDPSQLMDILGEM